MIYDNRIINIIEDHAVMSNVIDAIVCAIENDTPMPDYIPAMNDYMKTEQLTKICETITKLRKNG